ncbi:MAG: ferredoxin family protein [Pseudomonadota bacterium]|nr:ferredoxin family protein [Pseudomonadota bacterium]
MNVEVRIDQILCTGCGTCKDSCPTDVIRMNDSKAYVAYGEDCQGCFLCEFDCPVDAIYVQPRRYTEAERRALLDRLKRTCHFSPIL